MHIPDTFIFYIALTIRIIIQGKKKEVGLRDLMQTEKWSQSRICDSDHVYSVYSVKIIANRENIKKIDFGQSQ